MSTPWRENGFNSAECEDTFHAAVLGALRGSPPRGRVADFGCGNGRLLEKIHAEYGVPVVGIERDVKKVRHPWILVGWIREVVDRNPPELLGLDTILVCNRDRYQFEEAHTSLLTWIAAHSRQHVLYTYDGVLSARVIVSPGPT